MAKMRDSIYWSIQGFALWVICMIYVYEINISIIQYFIWYL